MEVTGRLKRWVIIDGIAFGDLYEDAKGRWPDGTPIHTSRIVERSGDVIQTRNSTYRLGTPASAIDFEAR